MKTIITMTLSLLMSLSIMGQNIAAFSGTKTPLTATIPNLTAEPLTRGPALTVAGGTTFNSGNWTTGNKLDHNHYIQWSVTASAGYIINISELQINFDRDPDGLSHFFTGNGPAKIRIRTSLDNFASDVYSNDKVSNTGLSPIIETNLNTIPGGSIIFRLYGFAANIGLLGPLGTLDIEGGLGEVLGLENTGIRLSGTLTYDGLLYSDNTWTPHAPNEYTNEKNALIINGTYKESKNVHVKNLKVNAGAGVIIQKTGSITINGDLATANNVTLQSDSENYSSLIVNGEVTGTVKYQRQVEIKTTMGVAGNEILISAPVTGEPFKTFRATNPNIVSNKIKSLYLFGPFNKIKGAYTIYSNTENKAFEVATGYKAASTNNGSFTFTGDVNTSVVKKDIQNSGPSYAEWNLIGNPYPSYIKLSDFLIENNSQFSSTAAGIYDYDRAVSHGWTVQNLAYLTLYPNTKIKPGQGFMVASKREGGTVSFTPHMRTVKESDKFIPTNNLKNKNVGFIKLNLSNGIQNYHTDLYFNNQSTKGLDPGYDARVYGDKTPDFAIYSHLVEKDADIDMAVQSLAFTDLSNDIIIPLGVNASKGQHIILSISETVLPEVVEVYLEDKLANTFTLLNTANYTFFANSKVSGTGRFFLHLTNSTLAFGTNIIGIPQMFTSNGGRTLHINGTIETNSVISVFDFQGRVLFSTKLEEDSENKPIDISTLKKGMYVLKLKTGSFEQIMKVIIE